MIMHDGLCQLNKVGKLHEAIRVVSDMYVYVWKLKMLSPNVFFKVFVNLFLLLLHARKKYCSRIKIDINLPDSC